MGAGVRVRCLQGDTEELYSRCFTTCTSSVRNHMEWGRRMAPACPELANAAIDVPAAELRLMGIHGTEDNVLQLRNFQPRRAALSQPTGTFSHAAPPRASVADGLPSSRAQLTGRHVGRLPNKVHSPRHRLKLFHWNLSGPSSARYNEFLLWIPQQSFDVICLSETRWRSDLEWLTADRTVHTGDTKGNSGVLLMISRKLCPAQKVAWQTFMEGRLLHVRLHLGLRNYDILGVYQWTHSAKNFTLRPNLLNQLDRLLWQLPRCNLLAILGDFNTAVHAFGGVVGTSNYTWNHSCTQGAQHTDSGALEHLLQQHELCVLNSWNQKDGPAFVGPLATSRIDYIICRQRQLDGAAKATTQLRDMPMIPMSGGHIPLIATHLRCWIPCKSTAIDYKFTFRHRLLSRQLHIDRDPHWLRMLSCAHSQLQQLHAVQTGEMPHSLADQPAHDEPDDV
eukprot:s240_g26.t1